ncbi:MAG: ABC transporter permease [Turneriella sp.]
MIFIALRQLWARKRQTILTLLGVMLGAAAYIAISGILLGFRNYLLDQMVNNDAHVRISAKARLIEENSFDHVFTQPHEKLFWIVPPSGRKDADKIDNVQEWIQRLRADRDVEAYAPQLNLMVLYQKGKISRNGRIQGIVPSMQSRVALIEKNIVSGSLRDLSESGQNLLIGDGLRENLGLRKGDSVTVVNGHGDRFQFKISGAFQSGNKGVDDSLSYVALTSAQNIAGSPGQISDVAVRLRDVSKSIDKMHEWANDESAKVQSWEVINAATLSVFQVQDMTRFMMTAIILIVAGFGIYNILSIVVSQKKREIAILRSIGYESQDILTIFMTQGMLLGIAGGVLGVLLGYGICLKMSTITFTSPMIKTKATTMMIAFDYSIYVTGFFMALISTTFASFLPAVKAGKMSPIDILRGQE